MLGHLQTNSLSPSHWSWRFMWPDRTNMQEDCSCEGANCSYPFCFSCYVGILKWQIQFLEEETKVWDSSSPVYWGRLFLVYYLIFLIHESQIASCTMIHFLFDVKRCLFSVGMLHSKAGIFCSESTAVDSNCLCLRRACIHGCKFWILITA